MSSFSVISIIIDSDRTLLRAFKKKKSSYDENLARDMYLNICVCDEFLSCQKWQLNSVQCPYVFYSHGCNKFLHARTFFTLTDTTFIPMFAMHLPARMFCTLAHIHLLFPSHTQTWVIIIYFKL